MTTRKRTAALVASVLTGLWLAGTAPAGPIHKAAEKGNLARVKELLKANPQLLNEKDKRGFTPLHHAAGEERVEVAKFLVAEGADVSAKANDGRTPLHAAAAETSPELVGLLLSKGADINAKDNRGTTPLHRAASLYTGKRTVSLLLSKGADVNAKNRWGQTPLHSAAEQGYRNGVVELLLSNGADPSAKDRRGKTPLDLAVERKHRAMAALLRRYEGKRPRPARVEAPSPKPTTRRSTAGRYWCKVSAKNPVRFWQGELVEETKDYIVLVFKNSKRPNKVMRSDVIAFEKGPLQEPTGLAPEKKRLQVPPQPKETKDAAGSEEVSVKAEGGRARLHIAAQRGQKEAVERLLANKAAVNARDQNGQTALHLAARQGNKEVAELLLASKAHVNARDDKGQTPLHLAVNAWAGICLQKELVSRLPRGVFPPVPVPRQGPLSGPRGPTVEAPRGAMHLEKLEADAARYEAVAELLLAHKADINAKDDRGNPVWKVKGALVPAGAKLREFLRRHGVKLRALLMPEPRPVLER